MFSMFGKKNKQQSNTFKTAPNKKKDIKKKSFRINGSEIFSFKKVLNPVYSFLENDRNRYIIGLSCILISLFLTFSFVSYFFSWKVDQDKVEYWSTTGYEIFNENYDKSRDAKNQMGTFGAKVSDFFMNRGFGIFAFCIPFFLFILGLKLAFKKQVVPVKSTFWKIIPLMIWGPTFLGLTFKSSSFNFGGALGSQINIWLDYLAGTWGIVFILVFFGFIISRFSFNFRIEFYLNSLFASNESSKTKENHKPEKNSIHHQNTFKTVFPSQNSVIETSQDI